MESSRNGSAASASGDGSIQFPAATARAQDSCMWYAGETCSRPRSCYDCLDTALPNGGKCAINPYGVCVTMSEYDWTNDFRLHALDDLSNYYPSSNATYCTQADPKCADCRYRVVLGEDGLSGYSVSGEIKSHCTGIGGCVCVAACEVAQWRTNVLQIEQCSTNPDGSALFGEYQTTNVAYILMGVAIAGLLVLLVLVYKWWVKHNMSEFIKQRRARFARMRLSLDGWNSLRQRLIEAENAQNHPKVKLQQEQDEEDDSSHRATEVGDGGDTAVDVTLARLVVERGDGYRPISPSEYERRRQRAQAAPDSSLL